MIVTSQTRLRWLAAVSRWAEEANARVVMGRIDFVHDLFEVGAGGGGWQQAPAVFCNPADPERDGP